MEKPYEPKQCYYNKVKEEVVVSVHKLGEKLNLNHNRYNEIKVKDDGYNRYTVIFKEIIPDEDAFLVAQKKYQEDLVKYNEYRKSVIPDEIKKIQDEIEKLRNK